MASDKIKLLEEFYKKTVKSNHKFKDMSPEEIKKIILTKYDDTYVMRVIYPMMKPKLFK